MSIRARKYNVELHEYEDILLPDECRTYEEDMEKMVPCAQCGRMFKFGEMYTSSVKCTHQEKYILHMDLDMRYAQNVTMVKRTDF